MGGWAQEVPSNLSCSVTLWELKDFQSRKGGKKPGEVSPTAGSDASVFCPPIYLCLPHGADQENLIFDLEDHPYVQSQPSISTRHRELEEASGAWFCACTAQDVNLHFLFSL